MVLKPKSKKVFVAISGGVDSSVAALLLGQAGYDVTGVFMRCYNLDGCAERDARDARRVAEKLEIPFYVWNFEEEYKKRVVDYMIEGYRQGITPNPDVMCNREIKFGLFLERALEEGADYVATGHYVRLLRTQLTTDNKQLIRADKPVGQMSNVRCQMFSARDATKDQSYFLWTLTQDKLRHCLFPIGGYLKSEVREIARKAGLPTAEKKDSQGICFLGRIRLDDFLRTYIPPKRGDVLLASSGVEGPEYKKIGEHDGAQYYTIGQRHIGVANRGPTRTLRGHIQKEGPRPVYVVEKDVVVNTVTVAEGSDNPALYRKEVELTDVNFVVPRDTNMLENVGMAGVKVLARVRYRQPLARATLTYADSTQNHAEKSPRQSARKSASVRVLFEVPQKAVAPGQSAVFYSEDGELLGGGIIMSSQ